jgi:hypothetical protein
VNTWRNVLTMQMWNLPFLLVFLCGLIYSLSRRDLGRASIFAATGFGLMLLSIAAHTVSTYAVMAASESPGDAMTVIALRVSAFRFAGMALSLLAWGFILAAIFAKRSPAAPE